MESKLLNQQERVRVQKKRSMGVGVATETALALPEVEPPAKHSPAAAERTIPPAQEAWIEEKPSASGGPLDAGRTQNLESKFESHSFRSGSSLSGNSDKSRSRVSEVGSLKSRGGMQSSHTQRGLLDDADPLMKAGVRLRPLRKIESGIPEAMPLMMRISTHNFKEPDLQSRLRHGKTFVHTGARKLGMGQDTIQEQEYHCTHDAPIADWTCSECQRQLSRFGLVFDNNQGQVSKFLKVVYENSFLHSFKDDFRAQAASERRQLLLYQCYQPRTIHELREYVFYLMCQRIQKVNKAAGGDAKKQSPFGTGACSNLSQNLQTYLRQHQDRQERLKKAHPGSLMFDSIFESGNLLQAEKNGTLEDTYNLYMQVDTNTRGHQQWFYFRAKGGRKGKTYQFYMMNFTKPGVSGGRGYKLGEHDMRIMARSKKKQMALSDFEKWEDLTSATAECSYVKTNVRRTRKDVLAAGADSDQEEWIEEAFNKRDSAAAGQQTMPVIPVGAQEKRDGEDEAIPGTAAAEKREPTAKKRKRRRVFYYYALRFKYTFEHDDDTVYFAFSKPVTYTDILEDLHRKEKLLCPKGQGGVSLAPQPQGKKQLQRRETRVLDSNTNEEGKHVFRNDILIENSSQNIYYKRTQLTRTIAGLPVFQIVIGRDARSVKNNSIVLITSRVHSGETPGSEVFRGLYNFITSGSREAKYLRRFYTFILVPCMNPDGVVSGNYRNSCAGVDLNRQWINPDPDFHPEVCAVKNLMQEIKEEDKREIWIFCDLHGHSKKKNSFFYGCNTAANGGFLSWTIVRLLPRIFAQKTSMFNYKDCRFRVEPYKIGTARIVAWKQFSITHSFTLENSFYGYEYGDDEGSGIFSAEEYENVGLQFMLSVYEMHGMWKQIKRELRVTHGWLKPRTLNEMTGVPAAQIKAEEAAQAKEEARKRKAIEEYEDFLKTYYKGAGGVVFARKAGQSSQNLKPKDVKVKRGQAQEEGKKQTETAESAARERQAVEKVQQLAAAARAEEAERQSAQPTPEVQPAEQQEQEESDEDYFLKMHMGLIKIQALIRGFVARRRVKRLIKKKRSLQTIRNKSIGSRANLLAKDGMKRQRSNQVLPDRGRDARKYGARQRSKDGSGRPPKRPGYDTSSDGGAIATGVNTSGNRLCESSEDPLGSNHSKIQPQSDSGGEANKSGETSGLQGSSSLFGWSKKTNASHRNLSGRRHVPGPPLMWREFFSGEELEKAYQIVEVEQRDESDGDGDSSMGSNSNPSEDNLDEEEVYRDVYGIKDASSVLEQKKQREQQIIDAVLSKEPESPYRNTRASNAPVSQSIEEKSVEEDQPTPAERAPPSMTREGEEQKRLPTVPDSARHRPSMPSMQSEAQPTGADNTPQYPTEAAGFGRPENTAPRQSINQRRQLRSGQQPRALTSQPMVRQNVGQQQPQPPLIGSGLNTAKLIQQSYKIHQAQMSKKQNINQVIKDCFIVKRMGNEGKKKADLSATTKEAGKSRGKTKEKDGKRRAHTKSERFPDKELMQRHYIQNMILQKQAIIERLQNAQVTAVDRSGQKLRTNQMTEAQSLQLVDWLNSTMKNMSRSQAVAFLQLIQERQIYVQVKHGGQDRVGRSSYEQPLDLNASTMVNTASPIAPKSKGMPGGYQRRIRLEGVDEHDDLTVTSGEALIHNSFGETQERLRLAPHEIGSTGLRPMAPATLDAAAFAHATRDRKLPQTAGSKPLAPHSAMGAARIPSMPRNGNQARKRETDLGVAAHRYGLTDHQPRMPQIGEGQVMSQGRLGSVRADRSIPQFYGAGGRKPPSAAAPPRMQPPPVTKKSTGELSGSHPWMPKPQMPQVSYPAQQLASSKAASTMLERYQTEQMQSMQRTFYAPKMSSTEIPTGVSPHASSIPQASVAQQRKPADYDNALFAKYVKKKAQLNLTHSAGLKLLESGERLPFQHPQAAFQTPAKSSVGLQHVTMQPIATRSAGKTVQSVGLQKGTLAERWKNMKQ